MHAVVPYGRVGLHRTLTRPKLTAPLQMALGMLVSYPKQGYDKHRPWFLSSFRWVEDRRWYERVEPGARRMGPQPQKRRLVSEIVRRLLWRIRIIQ
jgi:hypothetical protein